MEPYKLFALGLFGLLFVGGLYLLLFLAMPAHLRSGDRDGAEADTGTTAEPASAQAGSDPQSRDTTATAAASSLPTALAPELLDRLHETTVFIQHDGVSHLDGERIAQGSGTGFFIGADGRILTNWHVIDARQDLSGLSLPLHTAELQVILRSGTPAQEAHPARVLAIDPRNDLAVLKIERDDCPVLELGDPTDLRETVPVWSCGFPFGNLFTVLQRGPEISINRGHVTSLRHDDRGVLQRIQFDAAVNKGNSGGPLILPDGRAYGVTNIALGTTRVNFAVPAGRVRELLASCPLDAPVSGECRLRVACSPTASAWLDGRPLGETPVDARVPGGHARLVLTAAGHRSAARDLAVYDGLSVTESLPPIAPVTLAAKPLVAATDGGRDPLPHGERLLAEDFSSKRAAAWEQDTGGDDHTRTWYVQDGRLHQFNPDGMLHAIFHGEDSWRNYAFAAKVRIAANAKDGRAGLIFRAGEDGFALLRLHRESDRVQLVWHGKRPFGWRFLAERSLETDIVADRWYELEVQAAGREIRCLIDGEVVLTATAGSTRAGGVGFYSVDSKAAFDDARVWRLDPVTESEARPLSLFRYWFSDHFQEDYGCWRAYRDFVPAPPWRRLPGGCLQPVEDAAVRINRLESYDIHDGTVNCLLAVAAGSAGLAFRLDGEAGYAVAIDPAAERAELLALRAGAAPERLAGAALPAGGMGNELIARHHLYNIRLDAQGPALRAVVNGSAVLTARDEERGHGHIGLYARGGRALFLQLMAECQKD